MTGPAAIAVWLLLWPAPLRAETGAAPAAEAQAMPKPVSQAAYWSLQHALADPHGGSEDLNAVLLFLRKAPERSAIVVEQAPALVERAAALLRLAQSAESDAKALKDAARSIAALKEICGEDAPNAAAILASAEEKVRARIGEETVAEAEKTAAALVVPTRDHPENAPPQVVEGWALADKALLGRADNRPLEALKTWAFVHKKNEAAIRAVLLPFAASLGELRLTEQRIRAVRAVEEMGKNISLPDVQRDLLPPIMDAAARDRSPGFAKTAAEVVYNIATDSGWSHVHSTAISLLLREREISKNQGTREKIGEHINELKRGSNDFKKALLVPQAPAIAEQEIQRWAYAAGRVRRVFSRPKDRATWGILATGIGLFVGLATSPLAIDPWLLYPVAGAMTIVAFQSLWLGRPGRGAWRAAIMAATLAFIHWWGIPSHHNYFHEHPETAVAWGAGIAAVSQFLMSYFSIDMLDGEDGVAMHVGMSVVGLTMAAIVAAITH